MCEFSHAVLLDQSELEKEITSERVREREREREREKERERERETEGERENEHPLKETFESFLKRPGIKNDH